MKEKKSIEAGDEVTVDGKVYVVTLNAEMILLGRPGCFGCACCARPEMCRRLGTVLINDEILCPLPTHLIYKLKGDTDV